VHGLREAGGGVDHDAGQARRLAVDRHGRRDLGDCAQRLVVDPRGRHDDAVDRSGHLAQPLLLHGQRLLGADEEMQVTGGSDLGLCAADDIEVERVGEVREHERDGAAGETILGGRQQCGGVPHLVRLARDALVHLGADPVRIRERARDRRRCHAEGFGDLGERDAALDSTCGNDHGSMLPKLRRSGWHVWHRSCQTARVKASENRDKSRTSGTEAAR
jgi:hypothetical protein